MSADRIEVEVTEIVEVVTIEVYEARAGKSAYRSEERV